MALLKEIMKSDRQNELLGDAYATSCCERCRNIESGQDLALAKSPENLEICLMGFLVKYYK
jgi:hypothetical protein